MCSYEPAGSWTRLNHAKYLSDFAIAGYGGRNVMLHGMSADGIGLANIALLMSMIRGLIFKGLIDQAEARLWLNNAAALIEEDKAAFTKSRGEAVTTIRELVSLLN
jgi:hypothetical protein